MYIPRNIELQIEQELANDKVLIVLGARQVGKTTTVEHTSRDKKTVMLNCDIEVDRSRLLAAGTLEPAAAMQSLSSPDLLVIDEAQNLPEIGRIVKGWYDAHVPVKIVLLGSSSLNLLDQTAEPLTGRNSKLFLTPLLFKEVVRNQGWYSPQLTPELMQQQFGKQIETLLMQHMVFGGYPEVMNVDDKEKYLLNLTSDYLLRDVLQSGLVKSPEPIKRLLSLLAHQAGGEVNISELAGKLGIARPTVENYIELLERSYVIFRLPAYSTNQRKEIGKNNKIFFWDTGIRNALLKEFSVAPLRSDIGSLFESWIIAEVAKLNIMAGGKRDLHFWRNTDKSEVDLIVRGTNTFQAYEIKRSKPNATPSTRSFTNTYDVPVQVVTKDNFLPLLWSAD